MDVVLALEGERLPARRAVLVAGSESQGGGGGAPWGDEGSTGEGVEKGPKRGQKILAAQLGDIPNSCRFFRSFLTWSFETENWKYFFAEWAGAGAWGLSGAAAVGDARGAQLGGARGTGDRAWRGELAGFPGGSAAPVGEKAGGKCRGAGRTRRGAAREGRLDRGRIWEERRRCGTLSGRCSRRRICFRWRGC